MIEVSIEAGAESGRSSVRIRAESIRRALSLATELFPGGDVRVRFPVDPDGFFVEDSAAESRMVGLPERMVA